MTRRTSTARSGPGSGRGGEAETTPPRVLPQPPRDYRLAKSVCGSGASARRSLFTSNQAVAVAQLQAAVRGLLARASMRCSSQATVRLQAAARGLLARVAQRSRQREVAQLLEAGSTRVREAREKLKRRQRKKARMARLNAEAEDGGGDDDGDGERRRRRRQARRRWRRSPNRSFGDLHAQESLPSGPLHPGMPTRKRPNLHRPTISA